MGDSRVTETLPKTLGFPPVEQRSFLGEFENLGISVMQSIWVSLPLTTICVLDSGYLKTGETCLILRPIGSFSGDNLAITDRYV